MKKLLKWIAWTLVLLVLIAVVAAFFFRERLIRLYNVNNLFTEERIVANFSNMRGMFFSAPIPLSGSSQPWPEEPRQIASSFNHGGTNFGINDWLRKTAATSMLVLHQGNIVHEAYFLGTRPDDLRISWSMAKSFLSAVFGIVVSEGKIKSLDDPVTDYVPDLQGTTYQGATVRNVPHMASGVKFNEDYLDFYSDINRMGRVLALGGSMDEFAAGLQETARPPGSGRQYTSIDTHVLGMVLRGATGKSVIELMSEKLLSRLGLESDAYYLTDGYGVAFALGGLNMTTRDYARFGQLMLNHGRWNGEEIVPSGWAIQSVRDTAPAVVDKNIPFGYGFQWWVPENAGNEFFAIGIYGQYIYVNRTLDTVVVKTSADRNFRNDGRNGISIIEANIEMFRSIARGLNP